MADETRPAADVRTTPRWLRGPILTALALLAVYFLACFHYAARQDIPQWAWLGHWDMFTQPGHSHGVLEVDVKRNGEWESLDVDAMFPYQWGSGPRYARSSFRRYGGRMRVLAGSICHRGGDEIERVRLYEVKWRKTPGSYEQPRKGAKRTKKLEWSCDMPLELPRGRTL